MEECIVRTLAYFDIFDYPLTFSEIKKYLCCKVDLGDEELYDLINSLSVVHESEGYFYLLGRSKLADYRNERYGISIEKQVKARLVSKILSNIPTIEYIGINGNLAMNNAANSENIELFFVTKKKTLWFSRFLVNAVLFVLGLKKKDKKDKNKIEPGIFLKIDGLGSFSAKKTLFDAHEILKLNTIFDRSGVRDLMLSKNKWINDYFPNFSIKNKKSKIKKSSLPRIIELLDNFFYVVSSLTNKNVKKGNTRGIYRTNTNYSNKQKVIMDLHKNRTERYLELLSDNFWIDNEDARFYMDDKKIRVLN